jgi:dGTPase
VRVVERLENGGDGLNLTFEVRNGIACHSGPEMPVTLEGAVIRYADRIAYINHDIDDAIRAGILNKEDIPRELTEVLGESHGERINTMVLSILTASENSPVISMTPDVQKATDGLRSFLFENVYLNPKAKAEETKAKEVVYALFTHYVVNPDRLPDRYRRRIGTAEGETVERAVADFISGMTDRYAIETYQERFVPRVWRGLHE